MLFYRLQIYIMSVARSEVPHYPPLPIQHIKIYIYINNNIYLKFCFSHYNIYMIILVFAHALIFLLQCTKKQRFQISHMAASSTYGSLGHYHLQNTAYFLVSNFKYCVIIVSIYYTLLLYCF